MASLEENTAAIAVGADHAGFPLKAELCSWLADEGRRVIDLGTTGRESCDYPYFASAVAREVASGRAGKGILVCGTGIGMAVAANRHQGIRAANCNDLFLARLSREHNNGNVLCLGARVIAPQLAKEIVQTWLTTPYQGGRHQLRLDMIEELASP
ncbi:MAG: ribose 5-phosphate isomerase B [Chlorobiales bacterium]|nr:ribose 5-phosphate isomerase B [Chlorobiales bacterium]